MLQLNHKLKLVQLTADECNIDPSKATIKVFYKGVSDASDAL